MEPRIYVADTHSILWFIAEDTRISSTARNLFVRAERSEIEILVPTIVLAELLYICEKAKSPLGLKDVLARILESTGFTVVPFDFEVFQEMLGMQKELDIHDRIIAATSLAYDAVIISKDEELREAEQVKVAW
jgi:predicted nucleic acid-binding protein